MHRTIPPPPSAPLTRPPSRVANFFERLSPGAWNNFITPQVVMQSPEMFPLSVAINNMHGLYGTDNGPIIAGSFISVAPVMCCSCNASASPD